MLIAFLQAQIDGLHMIKTATIMVDSLLNVFIEMFLYADLQKTSNCNFCVKEAIVITKKKEEKSLC